MTKLDEATALQSVERLLQSILWQNKARVDRICSLSGCFEKEDIAQELRIEALSAIRVFNETPDDDPVKGALSTLVTTYAVTKLSRLERQVSAQCRGAGKKISLDATYEEYLVGSAEEPAAAVGTSIEDVDLGILCEDAANLVRLPQDRALLAALIRGDKISEAAKDRGCSPSTLHKGRKRLREDLKSWREALVTA